VKQTISTEDERVDLEGSLQAADEYAVVAGRDGRPWILRTMPCHEVWAFTYQQLGEPSSRTRSLADELPLPFVVLYRGRESNDSGAAS
jgi:hypothetical protein